MSKHVEKEAKKKLIAEARKLKKKGLSLGRIGSELGFSHETIRNWLNGKNLNTTKGGRPPKTSGPKIEIKNVTITLTMSQLTDALSELSKKSFGSFRFVEEI